MAQLCLKWNNYESSLVQIFQEMLESENLVDVTLACEGASLKAHKMVLAACSPYFQSLFMSNPCKHPIVILKDVRFSDLKALIEFMYRGEVTVSHDQLPSLLKTAETLQIKQLAEMTSRPYSEQQPQHHAKYRNRKRKKPQNRSGRQPGDVQSGDSDVDGGQSPCKAMGPFTEGNITFEGQEQASTSDVNQTEASRILELSMAEVVGADAGEEITAVTSDLGQGPSDKMVNQVALLQEQRGDVSDEGMSGIGEHCMSVALQGTEEGGIIVFRKKQSFVWEYFSETGKGSVKCRKCAKLLSYKDTSGSTSNMIKHLKTVHNVERAIIKPPLQE